MGKVISTRDVAFDEYTIFDGSEKQIMDNLMHSTRRNRIVDTDGRVTSSPQDQNCETNTFYEDETVSDSREALQDQSQYDEAGRKRIPYPTPPSTPPAAFIAQWMSSVGYEQLPPVTAGSSDEDKIQSYLTSEEHSRWEWTSYAIWIELSRLITECLS
ncbi:hypothetical protein P3342_001544 [Pyrenophora teres f. teres]|nr:hypothetical protein P3342_001544 [Pyrenophora teres f. teres]